mmetsp:Transcript_24510/g.33558  ORF Transcript_24510/g.33558 Transcript_24510/m.33558 type:complete len:172 (-) Transcript_24510:56-571(-)
MVKIPDVSERIEARNSFTKKAKVAVDLALARNRPIMPGDPLLSRSKVPTCVACDRPLAMGRRNNVSNNNTQAKSDPHSSTPNMGQQAHTTHRMPSVPPAPLDVTHTDRNSTRPQLSTDHSVNFDGLGLPFYEENKQTEEHTEEKKYVVRGGFKMPEKSKQTGKLRGLNNAT